MGPLINYLMPQDGKYLLDPLFLNQKSGAWPKNFAIHDLGAFPKALGHPDGNSEERPLEECGNMLIMTLDYSQPTGDAAFPSTHYDLLKQWNQYLIADSLIPSNEISTDDFAGPLANQTNLALKGMIGIQAMAVIANLTDHPADHDNYTSIGHDYITQW